MICGFVETQVSLNIILCPFSEPRLFPSSPPKIVAIHLENTPECAKIGLFVYTVFQLSSMSKKSSPELGKSHFVNPGIAH